MIINGKNYDLENLANVIKKNELNIEDDSQLINLFEHFDENKNQKLDKNEIKTVFSIFTQIDNKNKFGDIKGVITDTEIEEALQQFEDKNLTKNALKTFLEQLCKTNTKNIAQELFDQIIPASLNYKTKEKLSKINKDNVIDILKEYKKLESNPSGESLLQSIEKEWFMGMKEIKKYICEPLAQKAKEYGYNFNEYKSIETLKELEDAVETIIEQINILSTQKTSHLSTQVNEKNNVKSILKVRQNDAGEISQDTLLEISNQQNGDINVKYYNKIYTGAGRYKENIVEYKYNLNKIEDYIINKAYHNGKQIKYFNEIPTIRELPEEERSENQKQLLKEFENMISFAIEAGTDYGVDPNLVIAIIQKEVTFQGLNKKACSNSGKGYMQITSAPIQDFLGYNDNKTYDATKIGNYGWEMVDLLKSRDFDPTNITTNSQKKALYKKVFNYLIKNTDPEFNIRLGTLFLRYELNKCNGNIKNTAKSYNRSSIKEEYAKLVEEYYNLLTESANDFKYQNKIVQEQK